MNVNEHCLMIKQLHAILEAGVEGIKRDEYDSSATECYYDKLFYVVGEIRKWHIKRRKYEKHQMETNLESYHKAYK